MITARLDTPWTMLDELERLSRRVATWAPWLATMMLRDEPAPSSAGTKGDTSALGPPPLPSFRALFDEHLPYVLRVLRYLGIAAGDVDDAAQEVFVVVHRSLATFEGRSSLKGWLYGIARRVASDHRKRAHRRHEQPTEDLELGSESAGAERDVEFRQSLEALDRVLAGLDENQRMVFLLYEVEEQTMKEITDAMQCPLQTGFTRLRAAREHVRKQLATEAR